MAMRVIEGTDNFGFVCQANGVWRYSGWFCKVLGSNLPTCARVVHLGGMQALEQML